MRNFFVVLACMTSILLIVACAKSPVDKAMEKIDKSIEKVEKNKDKMFRVLVKPEFCGDVPEDSFDARRCKMSSVVTLPDDDVLIGLRMLDTAQVEYRKLSEVHLQCRADDNQPE